MILGKKQLLLIIATLLLLIPIALIFILAPGASAEEVRYTGTFMPSTRSDKDIVFNYSSYRIIDQGELDEGLPYYTVDYIDLPNACAPLAGTIIAAYYDITLPDLIPGFTSKIFGSYRKPTATLYSTIEELYSLMHVNEAGAGASESEFDSGLAKYIADKGYDITYTIAASNGNLDYAAIKAAIDSQSPVLVFAPEVNFYSMVDYNADNTTYTWKTAVVNHIFIIEGYKKIICNENLPNKYEYTVYLVSDIYSGSRTMIMGDISVHNAKGVKIY